MARPRVYRHDVRCPECGSDRMPVEPLASADAGIHQKRGYAGVSAGFAVGGLAL